MASLGISQLAQFPQLHALVWGGLGLTILPAIGFAIYQRDKIPLSKAMERVLWGAGFAFVMALAIAYLGIAIYSLLGLSHSREFANLLASYSMIDKVMRFAQWMTYFSCYVVEPIDGWLLLLVAFYIFYIGFTIRSVHFVD